jgi:hypothetical protein
MRVRPWEFAQCSLSPITMVGSGLLVAQKQFRRVQGHKQIPSFSENWRHRFRPSRRLSNARKAS